MTSSTALEPALDTPCVIKAEADGADDRYWTGRMLGRWPESLRSREKAQQVPYRTAARLAGEFANVAPRVRWVVVPAPRDEAG